MKVSQVRTSQFGERRLNLPRRVKRMVPPNQDLVNRGRDRNQSWMSAPPPGILYQIRKILEFLCFMPPRGINKFSSRFALNNNHRTMQWCESDVNIKGLNIYNQNEFSRLIVGWWKTLAGSDSPVLLYPGSPQHHHQPQQPEEDCQEVEVPVELQGVPGLRACECVITRVPLG